MNTSSKQQLKYTILGLICLLPLLSGQISAKNEEYFRWKDANGTTHYGSTPPQGVSVTKVTTKSRAQVPAKEQTSSVSAYEDTISKATQERTKTCEKEHKRLKTLQTPDSNIRLTDANGNKRLLTAEEIAKETQASKDFIAQACQNKKN